MEWRALLARLRGALTSPEASDILAAAAHVPSGLSRRHFLRTALVGAAAAATVDVEQLLWMPGEKTIFVPTYDVAMQGWRVGHSFVMDESLTREAFRVLKNNLTFANAVKREYDQRFVVGDNLRVRVPQRFQR